ncbi:flagellar M-ring protein FliF [Rhodovulum iodosum]|nr:flagellar basal-body MS-ring/collar protein FliF [Rhodovulum robiginosum]RSK30277.1 flagellar M-ring protein FliF [Rhodovulum robiginosum]
MAVWSALDARKRAIVALATLGVFAAVLALSQMAAAPRMALLYSGLAPGAAGEVVRALEQAAVAHEVRGEAIYVDARQRDALRLTLASDGLPSNGAAGYELLDSLSGFGTTSQMFDAAYWRAKEGELARTVLASPQIRSARVHLATPARQSFRRVAAPSAAVTVTTVSGPLAPGQAQALRHLVAASVAGLAPEAVEVIDGARGLILSDSAALPGAVADRAGALKRNVERLLEARLGPGRAVVEVNVATVTQRESIRERRFDPDGRVVVSTETTERRQTAKDNDGGAVTVASNLPDGDASSERTSAREDSETRTRTNYELSETAREILRQPGALKRLSVAVLIDAGEAAGGPLPEDEMQALHDLIASSVGFDAARGDVITLRALPFTAVAPTGTAAAAAGVWSALADPMALLQLAVFAVVALVLGLFVLRPVLVGRATAGAAELPPPEGLTGEIEGTAAPAAEITLIGQTGTDATTPDDAPPAARLRRLIEHRRGEAVEILRDWIEQGEERA